MSKFTYKSEPTGKYVGYLTSLEGSCVIFSDDLDFIKGHWCFGMEIFETNGLTEKDLLEAVKPPVERGVVYNYFKKNLKSLYKDGNLIIPS